MTRTTRSLTFLWLITYLYQFSCIHQAICTPSAPLSPDSHLEFLQLTGLVGHVKEPPVPALWSCLQGNSHLSPYSSQLYRYRSKAMPTFTVWIAISLTISHTPLFICPHYHMTDNWAFRPNIHGSQEDQNMANDSRMKTWTGWCRMLRKVVSPRLQLPRTIDTASCQGHLSVFTDQTSERQHNSHTGGKADSLR